MSDLFDQEFEDYRAEFEQGDARAWYAGKVAEAASQLTEEERAMAGKMGLSALTYLRSKGGEPMTAAARAEAQREMADKLGVTLEPGFDRPVAWWTSAGAGEAALAHAAKRGPAVANALLAAIVENQRRVSRGLPPNVPIPEEAL